jgi:hypothetical protein
MTSILTEAEGLINGPRNETYGHPLDDFNRTAMLWSALLGHPITAEQVALCMMCVKMSRECHLPKRDNILDIAGYAGCLEKVIDERNRRADEEFVTTTFGPL